MLPDISCVIIDDEPKAIDVLQQRLNVLFPNIKILGTFTEWRKGLEMLRNTKVDLLFLDISMPEKTGIDLLKLFPSISFQIILVTAHSHFALDAIKFSVAGYVLKPIDDYELSFAVMKALDRIKGISATNVTTETDNNNNTLKIGIPNPKGIDYLNTEDILYFESINKYTKVVTMEYSVISSYNLAEFKKILDSKFFFQIHRSFIINLYHVRRYETSGVLIMEDNTQIPVSKNVRNDFMLAFSKISKIAGFKPKNND
ncbi:MAG TPA: LytTR family DNA-binding domain-containing protein [Flavipsychrobacter sp.]|nr:LytTR family DNA-binding domain-containing protein [Flavipsychrobacter sp.]